MIGIRLGLFEIVKRISTGAMATAYRTCQALMDCQVAVKAIDASTCATTRRWPASTKMPA